MTNVNIRNMVYNRYILVVKQELDKLNLVANSIELGELQLTKAPSAKQLITVWQINVK